MERILGTAAEPTGAAGRSELRCDRSASQRSRSRSSSRSSPSPGARQGHDRGVARRPRARRRRSRSGGRTMVRPTIRVEHRFSMSLWRPASSRSRSTAPRWRRSTPRPKRCVPAGRGRPRPEVHADVSLRRSREAATSSSRTSTRSPSRARSRTSLSTSSSSSCTRREAGSSPTTASGRLSSRPGCRDRVVEPRRRLPVGGLGGARRRRARPRAAAASSPRLLGPGMPGPGGAMPAATRARSRRPLGLEHRVLDVSEVLAVDLERQRPVADDLEPVGVVHVDEVARARPVAAAERATSAMRGMSARAHPLRRDEIETALPARLRAPAGRRTGPRRCTTGEFETSTNGAPARSP